MSRFVRCDIKKKDEIAKKARLLIVTSTSVETVALHKALRPLPPYKRCLTLASGTQTYYVGRIGDQGVIHVQCQMGSVGPGGAAVTVLEAISFWNVAAVIMVGIAFGTDDKAQNIGDVLISKVMNQYEFQRIGKETIIQRGVSPPAGATLLNRFTNCQGWRFKISNGKFASAKAVALLSGEKLIDNAKFKKRLLKTFPDAAGGEMEGAGLFAAAHEKNIEWIVVKGICDFADGNKSCGKKVKQATAAASAVSYCAHVLAQKGSLEALGCPSLEGKIIKLPEGLDVDGILFEIYDACHEPA